MYILSEKKIFVAFSLFCAPVCYYCKQSNSEWRPRQGKTRHDKRHQKIPVLSETYKCHHGRTSNLWIIHDTIFIFNNTIPLRNFISFHLISGPKLIIQVFIPFYKSQYCSVKKNSETKFRNLFKQKNLLNLKAILSFGDEISLQNQSVCFSCKNFIFNGNNVWW